MKKLITTVVVVLITTTLYAQTQPKKNEATPTNNTRSNQINDEITYRLFPTQNMWTFIKLNTRNGKIWQVQYDVNGSSRFETGLSLTPLVITEEETNGRFTLYSTQNMYNFILLDQIDGRMWQVQWSQETEKRLIIPIY